MMEIVYALKENKSLIDEQAVNHSYDLLRSIVKDHNYDYHGALFEQVVNDIGLRTVFLGGNRSADYAVAVDRMLTDLRLRRYDITNTGLLLNSRAIGGRLVGKSYSVQGSLAVKESDQRLLFVVSDTGNVSPGSITDYQGRRIVSVGHSGLVAVMGLYPEADPIDTEIIDGLERITFSKENPINPNLERLLRDVKIDLP